MLTHIVPSLGEPVGQLWRKYQKEYGGIYQSAHPYKSFIVAAPISNTPIPIYEWITEHAYDFSHWTTFHFLMMDDQVTQVEEGKFSYIPPNDLASFEKKIKQIFLSRVEKALDRKDNEALLEEFIIKPNLGELPVFPHIDRNKKNFLDQKIAEHGGIDLLILAIGEEGQYAQVAPGTQKEVGFHIAPLLESYRQKHQSSGTFLGAEFTKYGMTLGPQQVLTAKHVIVIINGKNKRSLTKQLLSYTSFDPQFPLSIIYDADVKDRVEAFITEDVVDEELKEKINAVAGL